MAVVIALSYQPEIKTQGIELMARPENQEYTGDSSYKARPLVQACFFDHRGKNSRVENLKTRENN